MLLFKEKKKLINLLNHWIHVNTKKIKHKKMYSSEVAKKLHGSSAV